MKNFLFKLIIQLASVQFAGLRARIYEQCRRFVVRCMLYLVTGVLLAGAFLFGSVGLGCYLNEWLDSTYLGFVAVGGIYFALAILVAVIGGMVNNRGATCE